MRTRKSNRTKRYTVQKYDFEGSSDEDVLKGTKAGEENDENFDGAAAEESADEEELTLEQEALESDTYVSDPEGIPDRFWRQKVKPIRPFNVRAAGVTGYLDVEPVADGRVVRTYCGPYDRSVRGHLLVEALFGRLDNGIEMAQGMLDRWKEWMVLPPKVVKGEQTGSDRGVWSPQFFEREAQNANHWYERIKDTISHHDAWQRLSNEEAQPYRLERGVLPVLIGPHNAPREFKSTPGVATSLSQSGLPFDEDQSEAKIPTGWMFDAGGIVLGMDWAPRHTLESPQTLALCVIPHSDQERYDYEQESVQPDFQRHGVVQLWEFGGEWSGEGYMRPSTEAPRLRKTLCFECGRVRRVKWSPSCGFLAVICGDGNVYVVQPGEDGDGSYGKMPFAIRSYGHVLTSIIEKMQHPVSALSLIDEEDVKATALTWINFNRLVVGYSDGSIALWSIRPNRLLSRNPVHHNNVTDLVSGYPSMPYLIASSPIGGTSRIIDLRAPSFEISEVQALTVTTQPNLLGYSDHLLGFFSLFPSAGPLKTQIAFMHHAHYPISRRIFTAQSFNSCLSVGRTHPYLLVGSLDGSLWALNPQVELFNVRREPSERIKIFQHEHRPASHFPPGSPATVCGVSRIVHGFKPEKNYNPKTDVKTPAKKAKKKKKKDEAGNAAGEDEDEGGGPGDPTRAVVHEPLSRITVVEWNPNENYGYWAAAAMASGLVKVLDLGLERQADTS